MPAGPQTRGRSDFSGLQPLVVAECAVESHAGFPRTRGRARPEEIHDRRVPGAPDRLPRGAHRAGTVSGRIPAARRLERRRLQWRVRRHLQRSATRTGSPVRLASARVLPQMIPFTKAHAYGNDFLYVLESDIRGPLDSLARRLCDRHTGIGADGLIAFSRTPDGAAMRLFNADGSRAEVSGNGVRGLAAILLRDEPHAARTLKIDSEGGSKVLSGLEHDGARHLFRAAMGLPEQLREETLDVKGRSLRAAVMMFGNPQCVVLGDLPDDDDFQALGPAIERHPLFPDRTNLE